MKQKINCKNDITLGLIHHSLPSGVCRDKPVKMFEVLYFFIISVQEYVLASKNIREVYLPKSHL